MNLKVFVGILSARINIVGPMAAQIEWASEPTKHEVKIAVDETFGVDAGRSNLIERAKAWGADIAVFLDSDIIPEISLRDVLSFARQDFSRGYQMVLSPTLSISNQIMLFAPDNTPFRSPFEIPTKDVFEIGRGALGLFVMAGAAIRALVPIKEQIFINGPKRPLYCLYTPDLGEDYSLCDNIRSSTKGKIGCDPRLKVSHLKLQPIPSWREETRNLALQRIGG